MGVYIKGMEMPKSCAECKAEGHYENSYGDEYGFFCPFGYKAYTRETRELKRLDDCPLVSIPPHGRCIDADALEQDAQKRLLMCDKNDNQFQKPYEVMRAIALAPTIIPADEPTQFNTSNTLDALGEDDE